MYDDDKEKLAWAYLIRGGVMYGLDSWYDAVLDYRHAEKLAEDTDCNELKFIMNFRLAHCNINSYNFEVYNELSEKMKKYAVTSFDSAEYYYLKGAMYECGLISVDSAKYYIKKAVECVENAHDKTYVDVFFYYSYAELICDEDDSLAEKYILKSFEFDTLRQAYSVLGKIYLKRGDDSTAKQYFAKSSKGNYWEENEERVNRWLHEYYAGKQNYSAAYGYALKQMAAKDSILDFVRTNNIRPIQTKFEGEIEQLKLKSALEKKIFLTISISAVILAVLVLTVVFQKLKLAERQRKISEAQQTINSYNQKISELTAQNQTQNAEEIDFLRQKVKALEL